MASIAIGKSDGNGKQMTTMDGNGHITENPKRLVELLDEPYREYRAARCTSSIFRLGGAR